MLPSRTSVGRRGGRKRPQEPVELPRCHIRDNCGVRDGRLDLRPIPNDARVGHKPFNVFRPKLGDQRRLKALEGLAKTRALAQDRYPGKAGLETFQRQLLEEGAVAVNRSSPLLVVIPTVGIAVADPGTAGDAVGPYESWFRETKVAEAACSLRPSTVAEPWSALKKPVA